MKQYDCHCVKGRFVVDIGGTDRVIEPLAWYRATIFSDGTVEFHTGDALYERRLKAIGLDRIGNRVELYRDDVLHCFPVQRHKRQRGPKPGTVDRYGESDRALFADIDEIMKRERTSVEAAAKKLAHADKIAGTGSRDSRASRLAKRYRMEKPQNRTNLLRNSS